MDQLQQQLSNVNVAATSHFHAASANGIYLGLQQFPSVMFPHPYNSAVQKKTRRERTIFTQDQLNVLEAVYNHSRYPDLLTRERIAQQIKKDETRVQVWFKNRRAKTRLQERTALGETPKRRVKTEQKSRPASPILKPALQGSQSAGTSSQSTSQRLGSQQAAAPNQLHQNVYTYPYMMNSAYSTVYPNYYQAWINSLGAHYQQSGVHQQLMTAMAACQQPGYHPFTCFQPTSTITTGSASPSVQLQGYQQFVSSTFLENALSSDVNDEESNDLPVDQTNEMAEHHKKDVEPVIHKKDAKSVIHYEDIKPVIYKADSKTVIQTEETELVIQKEDIKPVIQNEDVDPVIQDEDIKPVISFSM